MTAAEALTAAPLVEIARSLRRRKMSPLELVDDYTRRIEQASGLHLKTRWAPAEATSHLPTSGARVVTRTLPGLTAPLSPETWPQQMPGAMASAANPAAIM